MTFADEAFGSCRFGALGWEEVGWQFGWRLRYVQLEGCRLNSDLKSETEAEPPGPLLWLIKGGPEQKTDRTTEHENSKAVGLKQLQQALGCERS